MCWGNCVSIHGRSPGCRWGMCTDSRWRDLWWAVKLRVVQDVITNVECSRFAVGNEERCAAGIQGRVRCCNSS